MLAIQKQSTPEQIRFREGAPTLRANGYMPIPLAWGASVPNFAYAAGHYVYDDSLRQQPRFGDQGIAVLTGAQPNPQLGVEQCRASWLVAIQLVSSSKKIAEAVDDLAARFSKLPAVRLTDGTHDRLYIFGLDASPLSYGRVRLPVALGGSLRRYWLPKDRAALNGVYQICRVLSANDHFAYSGTDRDGAAFQWRGGQDLMEMSRSELPTLTAESAATLQSDIETMFEAAGAERC